MVWNRLEPLEWAEDRRVLPAVKACSYFKLKDAEIPQIDPTQFLPFPGIVGNLILQPKDDLNLKL